MASKTKPVEPKIPELAQRVVDDPDGQEWYREARARWSAAELADPETPFMAYQAPALPAWPERAPAHVTRELLGRFLQDRDSRTVHDVYRATPECGLDAIRNGTFFHFWSEVVRDASITDDLSCPLCLT